MQEHLAVVAMAPIVGFSKTRLEKEIGSFATQKLYCAFMEDFFLNASNCFELIHVFFTPVHGESFFDEFLKNYPHTLSAQIEAPFFLRLKNLFQSFYPEDFIHLTGSDIPDFPFHYLNFERKEKTVYLGPDEDGGYYYIGTKAKYDFVFDIELKDGDKNVFLKTKELILKNNLNLVELPLWSDIDTLDDLKNFAERNSQSLYKTMKVLHELKL